MIKKQIDSFKYSFEGIFTALKSECHLQIHSVILILVLVAGWYFEISTSEWIYCLLCFALVISAELFNSAIEAIVDLVSPDFHPLAKKTKDISAGAVLFSAIVAAIVGLIVFIPKVIMLF